MKTDQIRKALADIVGEQYVTADPLAAHAYTRDASLFGGTDAAVVVRPETTEEVSQIMQLASRHRLPVVVRGGGTSIYGQPKGSAGKNLLLDMTRMSRIVDLNREAMTVTAQAGIIMGKLQHACKQAGFYIFAPAGPLHTVSLGGWLSGVAGGGGIWWETLSLTIVLADGTVVKTGAGPGTNVNQPLCYNRNLGGPDFTGLFTGDGGAFGIKTEVTIRLMGLPGVTRACILQFDTLKQTMEVVRGHVERVTPHPFDPLLVFGPRAMEIFSPEPAGDKFTVMALAQGHTPAEMDARRDAFNAMAEKRGGAHTDELDAMAGMMAGGGDPENEVEMFGLSFFNGLGLAAWLPFNLPRAALADIYPRLIDWREKRLEEAARRGFVCRNCFEFFTPGEQCSLTGEIDAFFEDSDDPALHAYVRDMILDFQKFTHELGFVDVYNQGAMSRLNAQYWSPGYRALYQSVKSSLDPHGILNRGLWVDSSEEG